ncbi:MAG: KpsF/GutQ family sugar-phosphate isomerase [Bacteroidetes bacterium]|nr:KpsF/GutQ family sugar-phosphate isomerase [Bacteroidota bacterium]
MQHSDTAKQVLGFESTQIQRAISLLDNQFDNAVESILQCKGKVVVCGIGKSGSIAQKVTATLCSTGTEAVFLHAAEAIHGDLGIYHREDVVIFFTKSGTSSEMLQLIPFFKERNSKIISIIGNIDSPVAKQSDFVFNASVEREADTLNLAPTASSTVALALGDAMAVALMHAKGFGETDFARLHPGGQLGKNLLLKVADIMHATDKIAIVNTTTNFRELIIAMTKHNLGAACVIDDDENFVGLITDGDVRRILIDTTDINSIPMQKIMTANPVSVASDATLKIAVDLMENRKSQLSVLPVIDLGKLKGLIRIHDVYQR